MTSSIWAAHVVVVGILAGLVGFTIHGSWVWAIFDGLVGLPMFVKWAWCGELAMAVALQLS